MPYGLSKKAGGDNPSNDSKMEKCVKDVMSQGKDKITAIKICKSSITNSMMSSKLKKRLE